MKILDHIVIIDSREQKPLKFKMFETEVKGMKTGDYTVKGMEDLICIERKSKSDLISTLTQKINRERFKREIDRMKPFKYKCVVVESDMIKLWVQSRFSKATPSSYINTACQWSARYVPFYFCNNKTQARHFVEQFILGAIKEEIEIGEK